jgi:lipopolysaccharide export system protein LptA
MKPLFSRSTRTRLLYLASAGLMGFTAFAAVGQISGKGEPIAFGADLQEADAKEHTYTYTGRVEMIQGNARLRADKIKVFTAPPRGDANANGWGAVERIVAEGNIYYVTPDQTMKGDHGVYTQGDTTMVLTGEVVLTQGQSLMTGNRLTYNSVSGQMTLNANPVNNAAKGRVRGVFYPDGQQPKPAAQPPKPQP